MLAYVCIHYINVIFPESTHHRYSQHFHLYCSPPWVSRQEEKLKDQPFLLGTEVSLKYPHGETPYHLF